MNNLYYIDFDSTLFDTTTFYKDLLNIVEEYGLTKEMLESEYKKHFNDLYNPIVSIEYLKKKHNLDDNLLKKVNKFMQSLDKYLYSDTLDFLEYLKSKNYTLIMLTYSNFSYQNLKINSSGIKEYFDKIIICEKYKFELDIDYTKGIYLDDNPRDLEGLQNKGAKVIRIRREGNKYSLNDMDNIVEYKSLKDYLDNLQLENKN